MKLLTLLLLLTLVSSAAHAKVIHKERSIYRNIVISEQDDVRCMAFENRRNSATNQACIDLQLPERLVFEYTRSIVAGLAFKPAPKNILIIGLGGGSLPTMLSRVLPDTDITSVEIDPAVLKMAKRYFNYQDSARVKSVIKDGRIFIKRALKNNQRFDWIILDAFNADYIPEHLLTKEFLEESKALLTPNGLLAANTFSASKLYDYESVTYQSVFKNLTILPSPTKGNRVIFACNCDALPETIIDQALYYKLLPYGVDLKGLVSRFTNEIDWDTKVSPLTDQYSPANLLK
ncbi:MAG: fused MFS/spermidine synthase [Psychrobium sp.]|nr:fused MFS/spermidine synthase [Psychrobium sp.]